MALLDDYHATLPNFTGTPKMPRDFAESRVANLQIELENLDQSDPKYQEQQETLNREIAEVQQEIANGNVTDDAQEIAYFEEYNAGLTAFVNAFIEQQKNQN